MIKRVFIVIIVSIFLGGCASISQSLRGTDHLLYNQAVVGNKALPAEGFEARFRQKPNRKVLFVWLAFADMYEWGRQGYDSTKEANKIKEIGAEYDVKIQKKIQKGKDTTRLVRKRNKSLEKQQIVIEKGNFRMRNGEPPAIFDVKKMQETRMEMERYLHSNGFFSGKVTAQIDTISKPLRRIKTTYKIDEGKPHTIDSVWYVTTNANIDSILNASRKSLKIKKNQRYDREALDAENARIEQLLLNNGYYRFSRNYIKIEVDTTYSKYDIIDSIIEDEAEKRILVADNLVQIRFIINDPARKDTTRIQENTFGKNAISQIYLDDILGEHISYKMKDVFFILNNNDDSNDYLDTLKSKKYPLKDPNALTFSLSSNVYSPKVLKRKISIRPSQLYNQSKMQETQASLSGLDMFRTIKFSLKDDKSGKLTTYIVTKPIDKYSLTNEAGVSITQSLPGPFVSIGLKNRNPFGGCEAFENNFLFSIDGQATLLQEATVYRTTQISFSSSLTFPQLFFPTKSRFKDKINYLNPKTRLTVGFDFTQRPEYTRRNFRVTLNYLFQKNPYHTYSINPLDANILTTPVQDASFVNLLDSLRFKEGNNLYLSFRNALVTSTNGFYQYNSINVGQNNGGTYLRIFGEAGGTVLNLLGNTVLKDLQKDINYYKFIRISADYRRYIPVSVGEKTTLITRVYMGAGVPYGKDSEVLPYEKLYFSGGINSIRGWATRRLGPGTYRQVDVNGVPTFKFEQSGNFIFEANAELRFKLWWLINMAIFIDAGNIWTFQEEANRVGGNLKSSSYNEIAVATGIGLRFDFSFLVMRLDLGIKTYDPAQPLGERWVLNKFTSRSLTKVLDAANPALLSIGIGYPF